MNSTVTPSDSFEAEIQALEEKIERDDDSSEEASIAMVHILTTAAISKTVSDKSLSTKERLEQIAGIVEVSSYAVVEVVKHYAAKIKSLTASGKASE